MRNAKAAGGCSRSTSVVRGLCKALKPPSEFGREKRRKTSYDDGVGHKATRVAGVGLS